MKNEVLESIKNTLYLYMKNNNCIMQNFDNGIMEKAMVKDSIMTEFIENIENELPYIYDEVVDEINNEMESE